MDHLSENLRIQAARHIRQRSHLWAALAAGAHGRGAKTSHHHAPGRHGERLRSHLGAMWGPPKLCERWFINPMKTIVISTINTHKSYSCWSYVHQFSYLGGPTL